MSPGKVILDRGQQFIQFPNMIGDSGFHRGRYPQRAMNAAEIVVGDVQRNGGGEVFQLLGKAQRQTGKPFDEWRIVRLLRSTCEVQIDFRSMSVKPVIWRRSLATITGGP